MDDLTPLLPIYRTVMRLTWRFHNLARHRDELAQRRAAHEQKREIRRQEWHLRRRGFWPCAGVAECSMWIRGRCDRVYCSSACRQAAYRRRLAEVRR
jgi:ferredoxin-NADP reductase